MGVVAAPAPRGRRSAELPSMRSSSAVAREGRARIAKGLRSGLLSLTDVLLPVDDRVASLLLVEVVQMQWRDRRTPKLARIGRLAAEDGVNLLMPVGRASASSRAWVVEHAARRRTV